ncbi:InlB B-repeat-containing protein [Compostibacter hankyongensis]|uniref:InlB B-repeat-containing protein n=1 Tax=Compostibacter hankyongensis TaxID=1007089 RepID=UPI0031E84ECE
MISWSCSKDKKDPDVRELTVVFDARGGGAAPSPQHVLPGGSVTEPSVVPVKGDSIFLGWFTDPDTRFDFQQGKVDKDLTLYAKWWGGPEQYVFLNDYDWAYNYDNIKALFGSSKGKRLAVGAGFIMYIFQRTPAVLEEELNKHLALAEADEIPVLVQLDPVTFMEGRPDLWNWWDPDQPGYDPDNRNNVEWTGWSADSAVKIGWLNWGSQIRLNPMPNLMSPAYRAAVRDEMTRLITLVAGWYQKLPPEKKYLFGGIKVTGEMAIGVNNWYYPNGNGYVDQAPEHDPQTGINIYNMPSRGVQTIGYAALKSGGMKTSGTITGDDIAELARRHSEFVSKLCFDTGIPRDHIFSHAGGVNQDLGACINRYACPSWSFYNQDAVNPSGYKQALDLLKVSDAPCFGIAEWSIGDTDDPGKWMDAIGNGLSIPRCRFLSVYANVVGNDYFKTSPNMGAVSGIKMLQQSLEK